MDLKRFKIDYRSRVAFECLGLFDEPFEPMESAERILRSCCDREWLVVGEQNAQLVVDALNELSNQLDELSRESQDRERWRWYSQDSKALGALMFRIVRWLDRQREGAGRG